MKGAAGPDRGAVAPHAFGEPFGGHHVAPGDDQGGQHGTLPAAAEVDDDSVADRVELAEYPQRQPAGFVHPPLPNARHRSEPTCRRSGHKAFANGVFVAATGWSAGVDPS